MKKMIALSLMVLLTGTTTLVFADSSAPSSPKVQIASAHEQVRNIQSGGRNVSTGWVEVMDSTHEEVSKGKGVAGQLTGLVAGGVIGARKTLHRAGAGAIDLLTFWIP